MPDPSLSEAILEARASAPGDVQYFTLEIRHAGLTQPIRIVYGLDDIDARLEAGAPVDPGAVVTFIRYRFDFVAPDMTVDGPGRMKILIENIDPAITAAIDSAVHTTTPVHVTFREYLGAGLLDGPENDPPVTMEAQVITSDVYAVTMECGFPQFRNKQYPTMVYTSETHPGLVVS